MLYQVKMKSQTFNDSVMRGNHTQLAQAFSRPLSGTSVQPSSEEPAVMSGHRPLEGDDINDEKKNFASTFLRYTLNHFAPGSAHPPTPLKCFPFSKPSSSWA